MVACATTACSRSPWATTTSAGGAASASAIGAIPWAGFSTLNRLDAPLVALFLDSHAEASEEIVLDAGAADDPLHSRQKGRFFHRYFDGNILPVAVGELPLIASSRACVARIPDLGSDLGPAFPDIAQ